MHLFANASRNKNALRISYNGHLQKGLLYGLLLNRAISHDLILLKIKEQNLYLQFHEIKGTGMVSVSWCPSSKKSYLWNRA